jgi:hypothetical protein
VITEFARLPFHTTERKSGVPSFVGGCRLLRLVGEEEGSARQRAQRAHTAAARVQIGELAPRLEVARRRQTQCEAVRADVHVIRAEV